MANVFLWRNKNIPLPFTPARVRESVEIGTESARDDACLKEPLRHSWINCSWCSCRRYRFGKHEIFVAFFPKDTSFKSSVRRLVFYLEEP